jgi:hypothetical protein
MLKFIPITLAALLAVTTLLANNQPVRAEETTCTGTLTGVTVDNLRVPQDGSCTLDNVTAQGTIKVETGATLNATRINVVGNIQAEGAAVVNVADSSTVGGSIQIKQGGAARIDGVRVNADIQFESNSQALSATGNTVGGNIQAFQNQGGIQIAGNTIDGNLQCKENEPPPTGGNNVVHGSAEDQCERLATGESTDDSVVLTVRAYLAFVTR